MEGMQVSTGLWLKQQFHFEILSELFNVIFMKQLFLIAALCFPVFSGSGIDKGLKTNSSGGSGYLDIVVSSNVDMQLFKYRMNQQCLQINPGSGIDNASDTSGMQVTVPVRDFKCINRIAYNDFLALLKADQFPYLKISIPHTSILKDDSGNSVILRDVLISVAGASGKYDITCKTDKDNNDNQFLKGTAGIKLTDLKIAPPVKFFGLIKVKNEIRINFEFCLKTDNSRL
jgi:hypothetical protein